MNIRSLALWVIGLAMAAIPAQAQRVTDTISGQVADTAGNAVPLAGVFLYALPDSNLYRSTFSNSSGSFSFEQVNYGHYFLKINLSGHITYSSIPFMPDTVSGTCKLPRVTLQPASQQLEAVTVSGQKPLTEYRADRMIVNVSALPGSAGTTAFEVLEKSPGVLVQGGIISMKGKAGVLVLVDDKPVYQSGADLENLLRSIPADGLDRIELMTNPPAKYDAAGNAGIINIISRRQKNTGFNGGINLVLRQSRLLSNNNTVALNFRKNKINVFSSFSGGYRQSFENLDIYRHYRSDDGQALATFDQHAYNKTRGAMGRCRVGLDYYQDEHTTWGVVFTGNLWQSRRTEDIDGVRLLPDGTESYTVRGLNNEKTRHADGWLNLNYRHTYRQPGQELTVDADCLDYSHQQNSTFDNTVSAPGAAPVQDLLSGDLDPAIRIYTLKADYTQPVLQQWKLGAGLKTAYTATDNLAGYFYAAHGITAPDYDKSNHFIYKENIHAAYVNLGHEGKLLSVQAGLRLEHTRSDGNQLGNAVKPDSSFLRSYTSLFPTCYVLYKTDSTGNHMIGLNYGRRIDRPYFQDLNPFVTPIDKFTYYTGNPFLQPAFTHSLELSYTYKSRISAGLSYSYGRDNVNETVTIVNGIFYSRPGNVGRYVVKSANLDINQELARWLQVHLYIEWNHIHARTQLYTGLLDTKGSFAMISPDCRLMLGKTWNAELSGRYVSPVTNVQFVTGAYWTMNAGIQKRFSDVMSLKLQVRDIFYTQKNSGKVYNLAGTDAGWMNRTDTRMATLTFSYRFGKAIAGQRKHETNGAAGEQGRVKG